MQNVDFTTRWQHTYDSSILNTWYEFRISFCSYVEHTQQASNIYLYSHFPGQEPHRKESRTKQQCEKRGNGNTMKIHKITQGSSFSNWTTNSIRSPTYYITLCYIIRFFFCIKHEIVWKQKFPEVKKD